MIKSISTGVLIVTLAAIASCKTEKSASTVTDVDGNVYNIVTIGGKRWMQQNLKTAHYNDGSPITEIEDSLAWTNITNNNTQTGAFCYYDEDSTNNATYGKLYNWYAVTDPRQLCPAGWHMPSDTELHELVLTQDPTATLPGGSGGIESYTAANELKAVSSLWTPPNTNSTNASGFTAIPAGYRVGSDAHFGALGTLSYFWSSSPSSLTGRAWFRSMQNDSTDVFHFNDNYELGFSVRCVGN